MKYHAHRRGLGDRRLLVAGEPLSLAELALAIACGVTLAVLGWASVVIVAAWGS